MPGQGACSRSVKTNRGRSRGKPLHAQHLTCEELSRIDNILRTEKGSATDALRLINAERRKTKVREVDKSTVYRYVKGLTHTRGVAETRGRKRSLSKTDISKLDKARRRLIKRANNEYRVTYKDVISEAGMCGSQCQRICEDALREQGVAYRSPRSKIYVSDEDAKKRFAKARLWVKRPSSFWSKRVHAYFDNKAFPLPLTPKQRSRFRQTMVTGHLRLAKEGVDLGFTKPREKHSFICIPSVTISAAVAKDKVIMWHVVAGGWNGAAASHMYEEHLKPALVRTWGRRSRYTVEEDGDRKGNTSGLGIAAKARVGIYPLTLPPRTPSLMPLDYAIWHRVVVKVMDSAPAGSESKDAFLARLRAAAMSLPKGFVKSVIGRMKGNVQALIDAKGYTPKND